MGDADALTLLASIHQKLVWQILLHHVFNQCSPNIEEGAED